MSVVISRKKVVIVDAGGFFAVRDHGGGRWRLGGIEGVLDNAYSPRDFWTWNPSDIIILSRYTGHHRIHSSPLDILTTMI